MTMELRPIGGGEDDDDSGIASARDSQAIQQAKERQRKKLLGRYRQCLAKGDTKAALLVLRELGRSPGDYRAPEQVVESDLAAIKSYEPSLASLQASLAQSAGDEALDSAVTEATQALDKARTRARAAKTSRVAVVAELQRVRALQDGKHGDIEALLAVHQKRLGELKKQYLEEFSFVPIGDVVLPVRKGKKKGRKV